MEHSRNTLGIREFFKRKNPSTPPPKNLKGKKARHLGPSHWLHEISRKRVRHHFSPGLISLAKNTLPVPCLGTFYFK